MGRGQTKYRPEFCKMLIDHMSEGLSYASFCAVVKIARSNMYEWEKKHKDWKRAKGTGTEMELLFWERMGRSLAAGKLKGNAAVWIFNMKNRFQWRDKMEITGESGGPIETSKESQQDRMKRIKKMEEELKRTDGAFKNSDR